MQQNRLSQLETVIAKSQCHFCDIGRALNEIQKNRLYKLALFETFEAYTRARWDMGRAYAYRLIKSYEVVCNLSPIGDILPANECQVRPLAQLELIEQRKVWQDFLNSGMEITALNIKKFIGTRTVDKNDPVDLTDQISDEYMAAVQQMMEQVRIAQHDHWQQTSRQAALLWNRVIREKFYPRGPAMNNLTVTPNLSIDDRFYLLLHKKIMNKTGSAKRRSKKYYKDQYKKTGIIPAPLLLAEKGIMEGRKCSGRPRSIDEQTKRRFIEIVKASCDPSSQGFIFITRKARTIKNYHHWLEQELGRSISLAALRRCVKRENLKFFLEKSDFEGDVPEKYTFKPKPVFDLVQVDGCRFRYLKIKDENGSWQKPQVIEMFDTGSRYMFTLQAYFTESSLNSVDLFTRFLLSTSFPQKKIRIRPDNAKGFLNLKRPINALNIEHSIPGGFYMASDFSRIHSPKDKAHLESSHRSLHNFEIRIIKAFEGRIVKTVQGFVFNHGKKEKITVTCLDIRLHDLEPLIKEYRNEHNRTKHYFSENGKMSAWIPARKFGEFLSKQSGTLTFSQNQVQVYMKYGFRKTKATVSKNKIIRHANRDYYVTSGTDLFSRHKSTPVKISLYNDKLFIFEHGEDGILLGEALARKPFEKPPAPEPVPIEPDEFSMIIDFLEQQNMLIDRPTLIEAYHKGMTLAQTNRIFNHNQARYTTYMKKIKQPEKRKGMALFNAFILDCQKSVNSNHVATYASHGDLT